MSNNVEQKTKPTDPKGQVDRLVNCPFCRTGNAVVTRRKVLQGSIWKVVCYNCEATGPRTDFRAAAIDLWNDSGS